jgi:hypothetical protein
MAAGPLTTAPHGLLPIEGRDIVAMLRRVPGAGRLAAAARRGGIHGYAITLSMPCWLNELLGNAVPARVLNEIQLIEAHLLVYLQLVDDRMDGQSQLGPGHAELSLERAHERLLRLFGPDHPFWIHFGALAAEQETSARWEIGNRRGRLPPFDDAFVARLASKGALLRWPAAALSCSAGQSEKTAALDDFFARFLGVFLLLDDLADFEEDAERKQINAVLCAAGTRSAARLRFYPAVARGAREVCAKGRNELATLRRRGPRGSFRRTCDYLADLFGEAETRVTARCAAGALKHFFAQLTAQ